MSQGKCKYDEGEIVASSKLVGLTGAPKIRPQIVGLGTHLRAVVRGCKRWHAGRALEWRSFAFKGHRLRGAFHLRRLRRFLQVEGTLLGMVDSLTKKKTAKPVAIRSKTKDVA